MLIAKNKTHSKALEQGQNPEIVKVELKIPIPVVNLEKIFTVCLYYPRIVRCSNGI
jgi:hypothetical protein